MDRRLSVLVAVAPRLLGDTLPPLEATEPLELDASLEVDAPFDADAVAAADAFASRLAAAKSGDPSAVTGLYRDHNPPLIRYLRSRAPMEAEDLASETWVGVSRTLANFDGNERAFRSWLFVIARNRLAGHYRSSGRRRTEAWPTDALEEHDAGLDVAEEAVRGAGADAAISALISGLSDEMAEVVRLRVIAGLSAAEAAALMGRSEGAVRVLQHRALRRLAERFSHREPADLL